VVPISARKPIHDSSAALGCGFGSEVGMAPLAALAAPMMWTSEPPHQQISSVPIPKFESFAALSLTNFGIERTLATH